MIVDMVAMYIMQVAVMDVIDVIAMRDHHMAVLIAVHVLSV